MTTTVSLAMSSSIYHAYKSNKTGVGYCKPSSVYGFIPGGSDLDVIYSITSTNIESIYAVKYIQWDVVTLNTHTI